MRCLGIRGDSRSIRASDRRRRGLAARGRCRRGRSGARHRRPVGGGPGLRHRGACWRRSKRSHEGQRRCPGDPACQQSRQHAEHPRLPSLPTFGPCRGHCLTPRPAGPAPGGDHLGQCCRTRGKVRPLPAPRCPCPCVRQALRRHPSSRLPLADPASPPLVNACPEASGPAKPQPRAARKRTPMRRIAPAPCCPARAQLPERSPLPKRKGAAVIQSRPPLHPSRNPRDGSAETRTGPRNKPCRASARAAGHGLQGTGCRTKGGKLWREGAPPRD